MTGIIKFAAEILFVVWFVVWSNAVANGGALVAVWQQPLPQTDRNPVTNPSPAAPTGQAADSRTRQQAYLRFIEAQRLKGEVQRLRNARLLDDAIKAYRETIQLDPTAAEPHVDLGELYFFFQSRRDLAEREALEAVKLDPNCAGAHLLLARLYAYSIRSESSARATFQERAIREYEKVAELDPRHAESWAMLAELYSMKNDTARQIHALEKWAGAPIPSDTLFYNTVMNSDLSSEQAYYRLSQLYLAQGRNREAISAAKRAYEANPESNDYARNLIGILRLAGVSAEELRIYSHLMKSAGSPALMIGYGSALVRAGRYAEAIEILREYVKLDPSNAAAVGLLAVAQRRANQRPAAIETLKAGIAKVEAGIRTDLILELAQTYEELGRNEEAIAQYEQVFEGWLNSANKGGLNPVNTPLFSEVVNRLVRACRRAKSQVRLQNVLARTRRAIDETNPLLDLIAIESLRGDGKRREALELAQAAARRHPEDRALKFTEALIFSEMKRFKESAELLRSMIKGDRENATDDAGVYLILSNVQMQSGQLRLAEESARKAQHEASEKILRDLLKREPDNATALNNLGYFMVERGVGYQEALKLIEQAVAIDPISGSFLDSLGWAHFKLGNVEKAREYLEKALVYAGRNSTIHEHLGDVLREAGRVVEARKQWEKALEYSVEADEIVRLKVKLKDAR
jgi:tetratricopeptide (TPR) repeat protein